MECEGDEWFAKTAVTAPPLVSCRLLHLELIREDVYIYFLSIRLAECETLISGGPFAKGRSIEDIANEFGDSASYAFALLGNVYR